MKAKKVQNKRSLIINKGIKIGTLPGTNHVFMLWNNVVWLITPSTITNMGEISDFMDKVRDKQIRFTEEVA